MRIGVSSAAFYGRMETEEQAKVIRTLPADTCEIFLQTPSEYSSGFGALVRQNLGELPCASVHPKGTQFEQDLFARSPRQTEDSFAMFQRVCQAGSAIGAGYYVFHGPFGAHAPLTPERIHCLPERFARMRETAARWNIEILWENVHWCALKNPEDIRSMLRLVPEMNFVLDVKQAWLAGSTPYDMLEAMGSHVRHVHVLDQRPDGTLCLPGEGGRTDWPRLMRQLRSSGYDGAIILEPYEWQTRDKDALEKSLAFLRSAAGGSCKDCCNLSSRIV